MKSPVPKGCFDGARRGEVIGVGRLGKGWGGRTIQGKRDFFRENLGKKWGESGELGESRGKNGTTDAGQSQSVRAWS